MVGVKAFRKYITLLGGCEPQSKTPIKTGLSYAFNIANILIISIIWFYHNVRYVSEHLLGIVEGSQRYYYICAAPAQMAQSVFFAKNKKKISALLHGYEKLVNYGKSNGKAIAIYSVEKLFLKVLKFAHNYSFVVAIQLSIMSVITGYFQWKSGALIENWKLFIPMMPVTEQSSYLEYSINSLVAVTAITVPFFVSVMHKCFFVFISVYLKAFLIDLSDVLKECDELVRQKPFHLNKKLKLKLRDVIIYHLSILELMKIAIDLMSGTMFVESLFTACIIAICMYTLDEDFSIFDSDTLMALNGIIYFLIFMFLFCYFADEVAMNCENISLAAYNLQWYKDYPLPIQKYLILIMVRAQHPSQFHGLNMFKVSLDFFTNMMKTTVSYFLMFRSLRQL